MSNPTIRIPNENENSNQILLEATNDGVVRVNVEEEGEITTPLDSENLSDTDDENDSDAVTPDRNIVSNAEEILNRRRVRVRNRRTATARDRIFSQVRQNLMRRLEADNNEINNYVDIRHGMNDIENSLKQLDIKEITEEKEEDNKIMMPECGICRDEIKPMDLVKTPCNHTFCRKCFFKWLSKKETCALCRTKFCDVSNMNEIEVNDELSFLQQKILRTRDKLDTLKKKCRKFIISENKKLSSLNKEKKILKGEIEYSTGYKEALLGKILKKCDLGGDSAFKNGYLRGFWDTRNPEEADILYKELRRTLLEKPKWKHDDSKCPVVSI